LVVIAAGVVALFWLGYSKGFSIVRPPEFTFHPPHALMQPTTAILRCTSTRAERIAYIGGEWGARTTGAVYGRGGRLQFREGCAFSGIMLSPIEATAAEMGRLTHRPQVSFQVAADGSVKTLSLTRSSGASTLDQRAVKQVLAQRYPHHNCGTCYVSTLIDIEFDGPVWVKDNLQ
jgi:Gram-negative bacterial TonB protein C-terminal